MYVTPVRFQIRIHAGKRARHCRISRATAISSWTLSYWIATFRSVSAKWAGIDRPVGPANTFAKLGDAQNHQGWDWTAEGGTRTRKPFRAPDPKSGAYANSATS